MPFPLSRKLVHPPIAFPVLPKKDPAQHAAIESRAAGYGEPEKIVTHGRHRPQTTSARRFPIGRSPPSRRNRRPRQGAGNQDLPATAAGPRGVAPIFAQYCGISPPFSEALRPGSAICASSDTRSSRKSSRHRRRPRPALATSAGMRIGMSAPARKRRANCAASRTASRRMAPLSLVSARGHGRRTLGTYANHTRAAVPPMMASSCAVDRNVAARAKRWRLRT